MSSDRESTMDQSRGRSSEILVTEVRRRRSEPNCYRVGKSFSYRHAVQHVTIRLFYTHENPSNARAAPITTQISGNLRMASFGRAPRAAETRLRRMYIGVSGAGTKPKLRTGSETGCGTGLRIESAYRRAPGSDSGIRTYAEIEVESENESRLTTRTPKKKKHAEFIL
ncbi:hypothetical protein EVAR_31803_1 [Eumeta japonica]|uniref:Uncharacterized protein n=1 Tax=Eumeta variegata TaxID=151549 RepID=A0A4C1W308_EUMVA|nr:hypothetical protein EVAR_31803_1 [Eumeta japonica]